MDRKSLKLKAKDNLKNNHDLYLYAFIYLLISFVVGFISGFIPLLGSILTIIVAILLSCVIYNTSLNVSLNKNVGFNEVSDKFGKFSCTYLWYLLYCLPAVILLFLGSIAFTVMIFICFSSALELDVIYMNYKGLILLICIIILSIIFIISIIWSVLISLNYSFAYFISVDDEFNKLTAKQCMDLSKQIMVGHKVDLFVLELSFIPWIILSMVTLGIAMIYYIPYYQLTLSEFYLSLKNNYKEKEAL